MAEKLRGKGITDPNVLRAIETIPRHQFLDSAFAEHAYEDKPFPIGEKQTISQPFTVAYQTQLLDIKGGEKVLEIGTGSGYQACILAEMGAKVYTIERIESLYVRFLDMLKLLKYDIKAYHGDGTLGLPEEAPFDRILVTAAAPEIPVTYKEQLSIGGIMIVPVGSKDTQKMLRVTKVSYDDFRIEEYEMFRFVPLIGEGGWED